MYLHPLIYINYTERFVVKNHASSYAQVFSTLEEVRAVCEKNNIYPTVIEATFIACCLLFSQNKADFNIIECFMGGKFDITNIFESGIKCTIVTSIGMDHMQYLGHDILEIALHKAGIQKKLVQSVISKQKNQDVAMLLFNYAQKFHINGVFYGADYKISHVDNYEVSNCIYYTDQNHNFVLQKPSLHGEHQLENLASAIKVAISLGMDDVENTNNAIQNTTWIGRLQKISNHQFSNNWEVWFDGAHNVSGANALREWIVDTMDERKNYIVIGKSANADNRGFIEVFKNIDAEILVCTVKNEVYPAQSDDLYYCAKDVGVNVVNIKSLYNIHHFINTNSKIRIIGCGSLYLLKDFTD